MNVRLEPVTIDGVENGDGMLAYWEGRLVAVFVRLSEHHGKDAAGWFLEKGFGPLDRPEQPVFPSLARAVAWLSAELADHAAGPPPPRVG